MNTLVNFERDKSLHWIKLKSKINAKGFDQYPTLLQFSAYHKFVQLI